MMLIVRGTVLAKRYRVEERLRREGLGVLYKAEDIESGASVAVKVLAPVDDEPDVVTNRSEALARFKREARAAAAVQSDYVVRCLAVQEDAEHGLVLVFELLHGDSLLDRLKKGGPMSFDELYPIIERVYLGLADIHSAGIVHRDIRPSHVFLEQGPDGATLAKIINFGVSKLERDTGGESVTKQGQSVGVYSYMPPEQIGKGKLVDHRADLYACATMIFHAMSGQLPFVARNVLVMVEMKSKNEPRRLSEAMGREVDPRLDAFLAKELAREMDRRFPTAAEALKGWRDLRSPEPR
jgi:serine/threonine-protein kinase